MPDGGRDVVRLQDELAEVRVGRDRGAERAQRRLPVAVAFWLSSFNWRIVFCSSCVLALRRRDLGAWCR